MKKINLLAIMLLCGLTAFSQAVKDRSVIPVAVNLNQVLRLSITNGGNIEFVFNTIDDYKNGLSADGATPGAGIYKTDFTVASSTRWKLTYGAEQTTFIGTDNPTNTLTLNNVGFKLVNNGINTFEAAGSLIGATPAASLFSTPTKNASQVSALMVYPEDLIADNNTINANAGDAADNSFTLNWRAGTAETSTVALHSLNAVKLIDQKPSPRPDRYVVNVLFDLVME